MPATLVVVSSVLTNITFTLLIEVSRGEQTLSTEGQLKTFIVTRGLTTFIYFSHNLHL